MSGGCSCCLDWDRAGIGLARSRDRAFAAALALNEDDLTTLQPFANSNSHPYIRLSVPVSLNS
jgi:hypothetical protein